MVGIFRVCVCERTPTCGRHCPSQTRHISRHEPSLRRVHASRSLSKCFPLQKHRERRQEGDTVKFHLLGTRRCPVGRQVPARACFRQAVSFWPPCRRGPEVLSPGDLRTTAAGRTGGTWLGLELIIAGIKVFLFWWFSTCHNSIPARGRGRFFFHLPLYVPRALHGPPNSHSPSPFFPARSSWVW